MLALPSLSDHLLQLAARATERAHANPFEAEIAPEPARWHVIVTEPNREATAAGHLIGRGFGTYLPDYDQIAVIRGRKRVIHQRMFPGYLFVFVWAIERQWRRIASCTGVTRMLLNGERPAILSDEQINEIQTREISQLVNGDWLLFSTSQKRRNRKRMKRWECELERHACEHMVDGAFRASTKSHFAGIEASNPVARNSVLHRALGMTLAPPP